MLTGILADVNLSGHLRHLVGRCQKADWLEIWVSLNLAVRTFEDLGLSQDVSDATLWHICQQQGVILLTANRNEDGPDSLEATIRRSNRPQSLPVFTLSNAQHFLKSKDYADRVVEQLLEYLLDIDDYRGTGRIYLP
jgi:hypothetical protein